MNADWASAWTATGWAGPATLGASLLQAACCGRRDLGALTAALGAVAVADDQLAWVAPSALVAAGATLFGARVGVSRPDVNAVTLAAVVSVWVCALATAQVTPVVPDALFIASARALCLLVGLLGLAAAVARPGPRAVRPMWWGRVVIQDGKPDGAPRST